MPRNASGTYSLPSGNPVSSGTLIDANWANNTLNDLANEVTDSLSRSAEGGMLAPLRLTDGVQATPSLAFTNEPSSGLYRAGTNDAWFVSGGNQVMQFTSSGVVGRLAAGAVGTPSLTFFGDLNTGLWSPAADTLAASTGGSERLRVDSSGNVGIGTASPGARLDVQAAFAEIRTLSTTGTNTVRNYQSNTGGAFYQGIDSSTGANFGTTYAAVLWHTGNYPMVFATNNTERMRLDSSGNLGIGTASPGARLNVSGGSVYVQSSGTYSEPAVVAGVISFDSANGDLNISSRSNGGNTFMRFYTSNGGAGAERMRITATGNIVAGASAALATTATDGFLYVPTCAGTPTGTPTAITGMAPIVVNTTNNKLYFYSGGAWRDAGP